MGIRAFDHVALPAGDPEAMIAFYRRLGFPIAYEQEWRSGELPIFAVQVGRDAKINFHDPKLWKDPGFGARGPTAQPGCGDLCFVFDGTIDEAVALIEKAGAEVVYGPFDQRGGGEGGAREGTSVYTRDPDGNLLELMTYPASGRYPMSASAFDD